MTIEDLNIGDLCVRVSPGGNTLKQGETYVITKINKCSTRGYRTKDGVSINQSIKSIKVIRKAPTNKLLIIRQKIRLSYKALKHIWMN